MAMQAEMSFEGATRSPERAAHDYLRSSLDEIIRLRFSQPGHRDSDWSLAQYNAFDAIHQYADAYGIGTDEEGLKQRRDFAAALNVDVYEGLNPLEERWSPQSKDRFIGNPIGFTAKNGVTSKEHMTSEVLKKFDSFIANRNNNTVGGNADPSQSVLKASRVMPPNDMPKSAESTAERKSRPGRLKRFAVKALAVVALTGTVIFGASRCADNDKGETIPVNDDLPAATFNTTTTSTVITSTTLAPNIDLSTPQSSSSDTSNEGSSIVDQKMAMEGSISTSRVVFIEKGSNVWESIRNSTDSTNISRAELDSRIAKAMQFIIADNPDISDIDRVYEGNAINIGPEAVAILEGLSS